MPTHTTITENLDGTFNVQVHDADALSRIQTMCDIIREDDDDSADDERALVVAYAEDLYNAITSATLNYRVNGGTPVSGTVSTLNVAPAATASRVSRSLTARLARPLGNAVATAATCTRSPTTATPIITSHTRSGSRSTFTSQYTCR